MKRDLLSLKDLKSDEIFDIFDLSQRLKQYKTRASDHLEHKNIGLLFQKPSNRTRVSFNVGINQLGGHCLYLGPSEINLGVREATSDVSKTLSRYLDAIVARTHSHEDVVDLAKNSDIPVINGLSDLFHPCQALTDIFTVKEKFDDIEGLSLAYVGDGNNVCNSLIMACAMTGMNIQIASPEGYEPDPEIIKEAKEYAKSTNSRIMITNTPKEAVKNASVVYADVWVSMGQERESEKRLKDFKDFQINQELVKHAKKNYIFMHCLPAHRGMEVTEEIIDGEHSVVFDQAENRLHTQKAILIYLLQPDSDDENGEE